MEPLFICPFPAKLLEAETCRDKHPWGGCEPDACNKTNGCCLNLSPGLPSRVCWCLVLSLLTSICQDVSTWDLSRHRACWEMTWEKCSDSKGSKFGNGWKRNHWSSSSAYGHHGNQVARLNARGKAELPSSYVLKTVEAYELDTVMHEQSKSAFSMKIIHVIQKN